MATRVEFDRFIGVAPDTAQEKLLIWISRADDRMTGVIEDIQSILKGVSQGSPERQLLKNRYHALLSVATANLQVECINSIRRKLSRERGDVVQIEQEMQVYDATD